MGLKQTAAASPICSCMWCGMCTRPPRCKSTHVAHSEMVCGKRHSPCLRCFSISWCQRTVKSCYGVLGLCVERTIYVRECETSKTQNQFCQTRGSHSKSEWFDTSPTMCAESPSLKRVMFPKPTARAIVCRGRGLPQAREQGGKGREGGVRDHADTRRRRNIAWRFR
jgi:hypothetical protein